MSVWLYAFWYSDQRDNLGCYTHDVSVIAPYGLLQTPVAICLTILTSLNILVVILPQFHPVYSMTFLWCPVIYMRDHLVCYTHNVSTTLSYDLLQTPVIICLSIVTSTIIFVVILTTFLALYLTAFFGRLLLYTLLF